MGLPMLGDLDPRFLEDCDIEIGGGVRPWAGKMWRIGCLGHTARMGDVTLLLGALGELLRR